MKPTSKIVSLLRSPFVNSNGLSAIPMLHQILIQRQTIFFGIYSITEEFSIKHRFLKGKTDRVRERMLIGWLVTFHPHVVLCHSTETIARKGIW